VRGPSKRSHRLAELETGAVRAGDTGAYPHRWGARARRPTLFLSADGLRVEAASAGGARRTGQTSAVTARTAGRRAVRARATLRRETALRLFGEIRAVIETAPFHGESYRKVPPRARRARGSFEIGSTVS
jgi:hypothetical protein